MMRIRKEKSRRVRDPTQMPAMVTRRVPSAQPRRLVWILMLSSKSTSRPSKLWQQGRIELWRRGRKRQKFGALPGATVKHVVPNRKPCHLQSHLFNKHHDAYDMVESINEERREEILKERMPKSTRFDEIVNSYVDWSAYRDWSDSGYFWVEFIQEVCLQDWPIFRNSGSVVYNKSYRREVQHNIMKLLMEGLLKDSLRSGATSSEQVSSWWPWQWGVWGECWGLH